MYVLAPLRKKSIYAHAYVCGTSTCTYTVKGVEYIFDIFYLLTLHMGDSSSISGWGTGQDEVFLVCFSPARGRTQWRTGDDCGV